jgi:uncharacterized membrane protein YbhN (UPF0104 family)
MQLKKLLLLKLIVTCSLIGSVFLWVDFGQVVENLAKLPWYIALVTVFLFSGQMFLATFRWFRILQVSRPISLSKILELNIVASFMQNLFLGFIGASLMKIFLVKRLNVPLTVSTIAFIMDRFIILLTLLMMIGVTLPFAPTIQWFNVNVLYSVGGGILATLCVTIVFKKTLFGYFFQYKKYLPQLNVILKKTAGETLLLSIGSLILYFIGIYAMGQYLDVNISFKNILIIMPTITLITSLPISLNGWGVRESAMIIGLGLFGVEKEKALALSIFVGILTLLSLVSLAIPTLFYRNRSYLKKIIRV